MGTLNSQLLWVFAPVFLCELISIGWHDSSVLLSILGGPDAAGEVISATLALLGAPKLLISSVGGGEMNRSEDGKLLVGSPLSSISSLLPRGKEVLLDLSQSLALPSLRSDSLVWAVAPGFKSCLKGIAWIWNPNPSKMGMPISYHPLSSLKMSQTSTS